MFGTKQRCNLAAGVLVTTLLLSVHFGSPSAVAEDLGTKSIIEPDVFSKVMSDLDQIEEMAFTESFLEDTGNDTSSNPFRDVSSACEHQCCDQTAKVCPHLAHPTAPNNPTTELSSTSNSSDPLAYSNHVRGTDVIPPVPNIEDYATPDEFVDEDMIYKLESDQFSMKDGIEDYCDQMAKLLSDTLSADSLSDQEKTAAIKSAMKLAVVNAQIAAEAKIVQIKASHESELAVMRGRLLQYSYIESNQRKLFQWLSPIYSNVNRNFQQIERMAESSTQLKRCLDIIQTQLKEEPSATGKNQLIVTKRGQSNGQPIVARSTVQKVSNQFVRKEAEENSDDRITPVDFQILELRLQKAERLIAALTSYAGDAAASPQGTEMNYPKTQDAAPTHRRVSYDRLMPITPLQPRR